MEARLNIPVALIFFNRPDTFSLVFEKIRQIKPAELFLIQDGPRNENDIPKIEQCRKIAENTDWPCNIRKNYSQTNLGCGRRPYTGISWAFEHTDKLIILEDDCVPDLSFFPYCEELLDYYEDDTRVSYISGLNHFETWNCGDASYFFAKTGSIWGWATWKKEWELADYTVQQIKNPYTRSLIAGQFSDLREARARLRIWETVANNPEKEYSYWDIQWGFIKYSQSKLVAVPCKNLIHNVGVGVGSTHAQTRYKPQKRTGFFFIPTHPVDVPLSHPECILCDVYYDNQVYRSRPGIIKRAVSKILGYIGG